MGMGKYGSNNTCCINPVFALLKHHIVWRLSCTVSCSLLSDPVRKVLYLCPWVNSGWEREGKREGEGERGKRKGRGRGREKAGPRGREGPGGERERETETEAQSICSPPGHCTMQELVSVLIDTCKALQILNLTHTLITPGLIVSSLLVSLKSVSPRLCLPIPLEANYFLHCCSFT